jgi:hypothetical protein
MPGPETTRRSSEVGEVVRLTGQVQNWCGEACEEDFAWVDLFGEARNVGVPALAL